jgi:hypothetical protein
LELLKSMVVFTTLTASTINKWATTLRKTKEWKASLVLSTTKMKKPSTSLGKYLLTQWFLHARCLGDVYQPKQRSQIRVQGSCLGRQRSYQHWRWKNLLSQRDQVLAWCLAQCRWSDS